MKWPEVLRLMTHPGVGPLTALAFVLIIGTLTRFRRGKQIGSYSRLIPSEDSRGGHQRLGHISKQGIVALPAAGSSTSSSAMSCDVGSCPWRCADKKVLPKWPGPEDSRFGCTGCGAKVGSIHSS